MKKTLIFVIGMIVTISFTLLVAATCTSEYVTLITGAIGLIGGLSASWISHKFGK